jgi:hypothetical protein
MSAEPQPEVPAVFISYSHDSDTHKEWVRELATSLRDRYGIDVILDQWEIGPGDDVPKFMEHSVRRARRVIMVCTEPYVRKADDGKGGAGYEVMIVTGELVADLGTRKFIPIMRQTGEKPTLPVCVSTRLYVDFSADALFDNKLEELARNIHQAPRFEKPPLGANPFANAEVPAPSRNAASQLDAHVTSETEVYRQSVALADQGDFAKWRELIHQVKASSAAALFNWRDENQLKLPQLKKDLPEYFLPAIATHASLFAAAFGAFDSKDQRFHNQLSVIDTIRNPKGWEWSGSTIFVDLPDLVLFSYQALMGGLAISRHNFDAALNLATTSLEKRYSRREALPLFKSTKLMGWPESLRSCTIAWDFLMKIADEWKWLHELFGSEQDTKASIAAFYAFLNTLDGLSAIKATMTGNPKQQPITVPLCFVMTDDEIKQRAKTIFFSDPAFLAELFKENAISSDQLADYWQNWMTESREWLADVYKESLWGLRDPGIFHADLPRALTPARGKKLID